MPMGISECDLLLDEILIRSLFVFFLVVSLDSCTGSRVCGCVSMIGMCLLDGYNCSFGSSKWDTIVCYVILFTLACVLLLTEGLTLTTGGGVILIFWICGMLLCLLL